MKTELTPFHLAIPVHDLDSARGFYGGTLQCEEGRSTDCWIDYDFFGHQLVVHVSNRDQPTPPPPSDSNPGSVDGVHVPIPHFGVVLEMEAWQRLSDHLLTAEVEFVIEPTIRFAGLPGEQATMFLLDPSKNAIEFKAFLDIGVQLFAK